MSCLFKQCLHSGPNGYFSSICWLGTKSTGLPSHLHQEWQCLPRKHGRRLTQRGPSLCKHVQTCKHRPSSSVCVASVSQGGETLTFLPCQFAVADKSQGWDVGGWGDGWVRQRRGGWVYCLDQPGQLLQTLLTDLKSLLRSMSTGDVMCKAEMATLTHDRPLPVSCSHRNYCEHAMQKKILFARLKKPDSLYMVQVRSCYRTLVMTAASR